MDLYDDMFGLFRNLGLSEEAAGLAACGREFRSEGQAREAYRGDDAEELADRMVAQAREASGPGARSRALEEVGNAIPLVEQNVYRILSGQPRQLMPWEANPLTATAAGEAVVESAREVLHMTEAEARGFVERIRARETQRANAEHAERFLATFAAGLRREVREVAPR